MALNKKHVTALNQIIATAQKLIASAGKEETSGSRRPHTRIRRTGKDAEKMKNAIRKARAKGVPVTELAEKYGVSTAYIYMMGT